jgi:methylenetetrahydrofolate dehydrogenase (NADP+) / methenyltetrahydrofolate cyclohydrolase
VTAKLLEGKPLCEAIERELRVEVERFTEQHRRAPCLAAVLVGSDPASEVYVRNKRRACGRVGLESRLHRLPDTAAEGQLLDLVRQLNDEAQVHGILVQLPLPSTMDATRILDAIHPWKDVDAFHPENVGLLVQGRPRFLPCTPHGVLQILRRYQLVAAGKHVVVVGRSDIVGKPLATLFAQRTSPWGSEYANATVTLCHSRTPDLAHFTRQADILVAAVGQPGCIRADMIRPGAVVIDVGINRTERGLCGDVAFDEAVEVAGYLTPVPGGVGPLTIAMLLVNTLQAATLQAE